MAMTTDRRTDLLARYRGVRALTEAIAAPLTPEDQCAQSMPDASPVKWHRAHTTWFFEEFVLRPNVAEYRPVDDRHSYLFNSYYETVGDRHPRPERGLQTRPTCAEVGAYRRHVDRAMGELLDACDASTFDALRDLVVLGLHHEQQHQELALMDVKHLFSRNGSFDPRYRTATRHGATALAPPLRWIDIAGGLIDVGHDPATGFGFDNEQPRHTALLDSFRLANRLVTCGEWRAFIDDDGYTRPELWLSDGWFAAQRERWAGPLYWERDGDDWTTLTLDGRRPIVDSEPVMHVSHYEADAYARWSNARLPTEFEWEAAAADLPVRGNLLDDPADSPLHPTVAEAHDIGVGQMFGDLWEWTASAYLPYPRFRTAAGAIGEYNGKFMSGQMVLRGGSAITPVGHVRPTYRNFFPAHSRWMFSGVRLANDS